MAEPFGIVSGAIGIASAFSTCVEVFKYVRLSRRFGKDYQTSQLKLTVLQLRLSRWGEAVQVYDDPQLGKPSASKAELQTAKDIMLQILMLFDDSHTISKKFKLKAGDGTPPTPECEGDVATLAVNNKMRDVASARPRAASLLNLASWSIYHYTELKDLTDDISGLVSNLEQLFPLPPDAQTRLAMLEVAQAENEEEVKALARSSEGLDDVLHRAVDNSTGHKYKNIKIDAGEDGSAMNGDVYSGDYKGSQGGGASHSYEGIEIKGTSGLRVLNGNRYGGEYFFVRK